MGDDREARLDPETEIRDGVVREVLADRPRTISILDVGAGPLTWLGYRYPGKTLTIVPVDPLADEYDRLLREASLEPPIRTIRVAGEGILEHFGAASFDIAYATNALDHSADPFTIIRTWSARPPGGVVILRHKRNEGASARYSGLHAWNFDVVDGRLVLWNEANQVDVGAALGLRAGDERLVGGHRGSRASRREAGLIDRRGRPLSASVFGDAPLRYWPDSRQGIAEWLVPIRRVGRPPSIAR